MSMPRALTRTQAHAEMMAFRWAEGYPTKPEWFEKGPLGLVSALARDYQEVILSRGAEWHEKYGNAAEQEAYRRREISRVPRAHAATGARAHTEMEV